MAQVDSENSIAMPAGGADALFRRTDISPETFFAALGRARRAAADEIERLIQWLDSTIDVDEDSAVDDDPCDGDDNEPSLGSFDRLSNQLHAWKPTTAYGSGYDVDCERDDCDREDADPDEAKLQPAVMGEG
jgi:hypothetical protein